MNAALPRNNPSVRIHRTWYTRPAAPDAKKSRVIVRDRSIGEGDALSLGELSGITVRERIPALTVNHRARNDIGAIPLRR